MGNQNVLLDEHNDKPDIKKFREHLNPASFRNNMFEVKFKSIPGATPAQVERLTFLINGTKIPSIGGYERDWHIRVLMDIELYDLFRTWVDSIRIEAKSEATIVLFKRDGSILREYPVNDLKIVQVSSIDLDWNAAQYEYPTFEVFFKSEPEEIRTKSKIRKKYHRKLR